MRPLVSPIRSAALLVTVAFPCASAWAQQSGAPAPVTAPAAAEEPRVISLTATGSTVWDDNVFRLPSSAPSSSERISSAYVGLHIDKPYGQQRFLLNVTQGAVRYQNFSYLNFNPFTYDGAWLWQLSPRVSGTLSTTHGETLYRFEDSRNITQQILTTTDNTRFSVDGRLFGGWHLLGAAIYDKTENSSPVPQTPNYRATGGEGGINYMARSGSSIGFNYRGRHGEYVDRLLDPVLQLDDGFESKEWEVLVNWLPGGASRLTARAAWYDYRAIHFSGRDFSGPTGSLTYNWAPTGKLRFVFSGARTLEAYWLNVSSYRATNTYSFAPTWDVTAKITVRMELAYLTDDYRGPIIPYSGPLRSDSTRRGMLGLDWTPWHNVTLGASVRLEQRKSNFDINDYEDTLTSLTAALRF